MTKNPLTNKSARRLAVALLAVLLLSSVSFGQLTRRRRTVRRVRVTRVRRSAAAGRIYTTGPGGGCYYINKNGKKTYTSKSRCM